MTAPTDTFAPSGRPRWAVWSWVDHNNVFVEIPILGKPPFISKYPKTPDGLSRALADMMKYHTVECGTQTYIPPPRQLMVPASNDTRAKALAILRKHKIL